MARTVVAATVALSLAGECSAFGSVPSLRSRASGVRSLTAMSGQEFKGFGQEQKKVKKAEQTNSEPADRLSKDDAKNMVKDIDSMPAMRNTVTPSGARKVVNKQARQDPVNLDGGAMLDVGWVKKSFDTVMSDEWKNAAKEEKKTVSGTCEECGGTGRIQGGLGAMPLFEWWPIKAFRPCPTCEAEGRSYTRRGQVLDEVLFGSTDMPVDYEAKPDNRGLTTDDVKKIMKKKGTKPENLK